MSLNPEPSAPEERAEHHLPPKSYADAAEEALEPQSHANGTDGTMEDSGYRSRGSKTDEVKTNGITTPADDDRTSLEGLGQDGSPRSPTVKGHRRVSSRNSHGSLGRIHEKHANGHGETLTSVKPQHEFQVAKADRRSDLKRRNSELTTGRQAGAGWSKSK